MIRCWLGWHKRSCYQVKAGMPWVFYIHCLRCGKAWEEDRYYRPILAEQKREVRRYLE